MNLNELLVVVVLVAAVSILGTLLYADRRTMKSTPVEIARAGIGAANISDEKAAQLAKSRTRGHALQFVSSSGQIAFEIKRASKALGKTGVWQTEKVGPRSAAWLEPCLAQAIELLKVPVLAKLGSSQTFHVVFKGGGELMRAKNGEGFRATLVDKNSRDIVSQGLLQPVVNNPANVLMVWEVAAAIVGRKYLVDINNNLKRLRASVENVDGFLRDERLARLESDSNEIERIAERIRENPSLLFHSPALQSNLENIRRDAMVVSRATFLEIKRQSNILRGVIDLTGLRNAPVEQVVEPSDRVLDALKVASLSLLVGAYCCALLGSYVEDDSLRRMRSEELGALRCQLDTEGTAFKALAEEKLSHLYEVFRFRQNVSSKRAALRDSIQENFVEAFNLLESVRVVLHDVTAEKSILEQGTTDMGMLVTTSREGRIISVDGVDARTHN